jgi:glycerophosphoryl diester phosphodiesterase
VPAVPKLTGPPRRLKRVGHKGADALAPGNTAESFAAAVAAGVDMIEFDVLRTRDGRVVLAHDFEDAARRAPLSLDEGLDLLASDAFAGVELDADLKLPGYEREVVEGLRARGLLGRTLVSSMYRSSLARLAELAPGLRRGWSVPRVRRDYTQRRWALPALVGARYLRAQLPSQARAMLGEGRCEAVIAHWMLVSRELARAVREEGGELYVWTVDDRRRLEQLAALGVDAVITNDPRLFAGLDPAPV